MEITILKNYLINVTHTQRNSIILHYSKLQHRSPYLRRNVGSRCLCKAVVKEELSTCFVSSLALPLLASLVHGEVVVVHVGVVALQLVQLDVDYPLLVLLGHQAGVLVLTLLIHPPLPAQLLVLCQHLRIEQRIPGGVEGELLIVAEQTIVVFELTVVPVMPRPAVLQDAQGVDMARHQVSPGCLLEVPVLMEPLVEPVLIVAPWSLPILIMVSIVVPLLIISTIIPPIMELVATSSIVVLIVLVVVVVLEPSLVMVTSVANLVVPSHFVARLLHVVVVSLLVRLHVVVPLVMGVHVVVSLMLRLLLLLLLLLDHLRALTELRWRMIEAVGVLQLVDRGRLVLYMLALLVLLYMLALLVLLLHMMALLMLYMLPLLMLRMLMTRWWLLHLHLLLHMRMTLGLVPPLMVKRDCIAIPHSRVAGIKRM